MNAPLTSPSFPNGLPKIGTEAEARAARPISMFAVIQAGAVAAVKADPCTLLRGCPDCGTTPKTNPSFHGNVVLYCDNDNCPCINNDGWPQATGASMTEAATKWNALGTEIEQEHDPIGLAYDKARDEHEQSLEAIGCGSIK